MTDRITTCLFAEQDLTENHHQRICHLLVRAFPRYANLFSKVSYYYARPDYRVWLEDDTGNMVAHLDFEERLIAVNGVDVLIAGVGEVATHPDYQGQGLGRLLMHELKTILKEQFNVAYGFLQCRDEVVGYYEKVGWHRVYQPVHEEDVDSGKTQITHSPSLIFPIHQPVDNWISEGDIDLRGLPW